MSGGGFGAKYLIYPEEVVVPLAARLLGRPVKWIEDRREHFLTRSRSAINTGIYKSPSTRRPRSSRVRGTLINDQGAYTPQGVNVSYNSATALPGPYRVPNYELRVLAVETNKVPRCPSAAQDIRRARSPSSDFSISPPPGSGWTERKFAAETSSPRRPCRTPPR